MILDPVPNKKKTGHGTLPSKVSSRSLRSHGKHDRHLCTVRVRVDLKIAVKLAHPLFHAANADADLRGAHFPQSFRRNTFALVADLELYDAVRVA
jgi:hypothetical protein